MAQGKPRKALTLSINMRISRVLATALLAWWCFPAPALQATNVKINPNAVTVLRNGNIGSSGGAGPAVKGTPQRTHRHSRGFVPGWPKTDRSFAFGARIAEYAAFAGIKQPDILGIRVPDVRGGNAQFIQVAARAGVTSRAIRVARDYINKAFANLSKDRGINSQLLAQKVRKVQIKMDEVTFWHITPDTDDGWLRGKRNGFKFDLPRDEINCILPGITQGNVEGFVLHSRLNDVFLCPAAYIIHSGNDYPCCPWRTYRTDFYSLVHKLIHEVVHTSGIVDDSKGVNYNVECPTELITSYIWVYSGRHPHWRDTPIESVPKSVYHSRCRSKFGNRYFDYKNIPASLSVFSSSSSS